MIQLRSALASLDSTPSFSLCACLAVVLALLPAHLIGATEDGGGACDEALRGVDGACAGSSETSSEEELEDKVWEECESHVTVVHGGENLNPEHCQLVETLFDQTMATMEDKDAC
jgi:hypothetical protein